MGRIRHLNGRANPLLSATYATGGEVRSKAKADGTDQTALVQAELDALYDAGGGTLVLPASPLGAVPIKVTNLTLKNDAATPAKMPTIVLRGQGMHWSGRGTAPQGGTIIEFTGTDTYGLIKSNAIGALVATGITFTNTNAAQSTPFVYTTNTTLHIFRCAFVGAKTGTSCDQDGIILGGVNQVDGGNGWTDGFQGYGTVIADNFFSGIRRVVVGQAYANAIQVVRNTIWATCGNAAGGAIEWDGKPGTGTQSAAGGTVGWNLIEMVNYQYGVKARNLVGMSIVENDCYDAAATAVAAIHLETTALSCRVTSGYFAGTKPYLIDEGGSSLFEDMNSSGYRSVETRDKISRGVMLAGGQGGAGLMSGTTLGNWAYVKAGDPTAHPHSRIYLATRPATQVTDGATTNASRTLTSASAAFVSTDKDLPIGGTGIPAATFISKIVNATTVEMTKAATATATGVTVNIGRLGTEVLQVLFERNHMTAQGNAPTIAAQAGLGSAPTVSVAGRDIAGTVTLTAGTTPAAGTLARITNATASVSNRRICLTPSNQAAAQLGNVWVARFGTSGWDVITDGTPVATTQYTWDYIIVDAG